MIASRFILRFRSALSIIIDENVSTIWTPETSHASLSDAYFYSTPKGDAMPPGVGF